MSIYTHEWIHYCETNHTMALPNKMLRGVHRGRSGKSTDTRRRKCEVVLMRRFNILNEDNKLFVKSQTELQLDIATEPVLIWMSDSIKNIFVT